MRFVFALLCCLPVCLISSSGAQQIPSEIPDAPAAAGTQVQADATATRTLSGVVTDVDGALVPGATVTLLENFSVKGRSVVADANGHFSFEQCGGRAVHADDHGEGDAAEDAAGDAESG